ncbi:MAG: hypothetical protein ACLVH8_03440 [Fusobacterium sp.]
MAHYLQKGFKLSYLLNLTETEKMFFIFSLQATQKEQAEYDAEKIKALASVFTGGA